MAKAPASKHTALEQDEATPPPDTAASAEQDEATPPPKTFDEVARKRAWHEARAKAIDQLVLRMQGVEDLYGADAVHTAIGAWQSRPRTRFDEMLNSIADTVHTMHRLPRSRRSSPSLSSPSPSPNPNRATRRSLSSVWFGSHSAPHAKRHRRCEYCGRKFTFERSTARYCGDGCRWNAHYHRRKEIAGSDWHSPPEIIEAAREVFGGTIVLDPASCAKANETVRAEQFYAPREDGLRLPWRAETLFLNPPYGRSIGCWVDLLVVEYAVGNVTEALVLLPARVGTAWFARLAPYPRCLIRGRLRFSGSATGGPFSWVVFYVGSHGDRFRAKRDARAGARGGTRPVSGTRLERSLTVTDHQDTERIRPTYEDYPTARSQRKSGSAAARPPVTTAVSSRSPAN